MPKPPKFTSYKIVRNNPDPSVLAELPPPETRRWVASRKAEVVAAVHRGDLTELDACLRYGLTPEEFESWKELANRHGQKGLRVTRLQKYQRRQLRRDAKMSPDSSPGDQPDR